MTSWFGRGPRWPTGSTGTSRSPVRATRRVPNLLCLKRHLSARLRPEGEIEQAPDLVSNSIPPEQCFGPSAFGGSSTHGVKPCRSEAEPVNTYTGSYYTAHTDARLGGIGLPFSFTRSYNSADTTSGPLGPGWSHSYNLYLVIGAGKKSATLHAEDGIPNVALAATSPRHAALHPGVGEPREVGASSRLPSGGA